MYNFFSYKEFTLEYMKIGNGEKTLFYFHGFGKNALEIYEYELENIDRFTIYSFNFFHHGKSVYPENRIDQNTLTSSELTNFFLAFMETNCIDKFGLMGYSMGGKICLELFQRFFEQVEFIILSAPDGIKQNFWYKISANNRIGNSIYRFSVRRPKLLFAFTKIFSHLRLLHPRLGTFVQNQLNSPEKREHVYKVWMTMRKINPTVKHIVELIEKQNTPVLLNYGKYDRVIRPKTGIRFSARIRSCVTLNIIEKGHNLPHPLTGKYIDTFLKGI